MCPLPGTPIDEENIPRYTRGFEWFTYLAKSQMTGRPWRRLGIFTFHDAPYVESDLLYLSPKQVMLAMAALTKAKSTSIVMVVDAMEQGEMGLSTSKGFTQFMELYDAAFPDAAKFYFGPKDSERTWLHEYPVLKIPLHWLVKRPNMFAEVLCDASPIGELIGPGDAAFEDFAGMIEVLLEKLGPPSLTEEVLGKIRSTEASEYAGEAVGLMTVFISPATAVTRGVRYLGKFMGLVKDRRKQELKDVYSEWATRVREGYTEDNLRKFFDDDESYESGLLKAVQESRPVLLVLETRGTLFDLFMPLILQQLVEVVGYIPPELRPHKAPSPDEKNTQPAVKTDASGPRSTDEFEGMPKVVLFLDAATHLSKFNRSFKFALKLPERYPNMSVASSFFTERDKISQALQDGVIEYMTERALVFDLHPHLFDEVTNNIPISVKAWLMGELQEMERIRSSGEVAFLEYYAPDKKKWILRQVEKPTPAVIREVRSWFRRRP